MAQSSRRLSNWVLKYSEAIDIMSESPVSFNTWAAISVIGSVLKKRVYVNRGPFTIYPNQYIVLVSPPGIGKGLAIHPALAFSKDAVPPLANYMSDRITAPKIIEKLAAGFSSVTVANGLIIQGNEASCCLQATELASFLSSSEWMMTFLCDAWDRGEYEYDTKNKGTFHIKGMCVSLIGACVPEFIQAINKDRGNAINGGFTARTIFVFAREKSKSIVWPHGFSHPNHIQIKADLSHDLAQISKLVGEFTFDPISKVKFERFYAGIKQHDDDTEVVAHFKSRQPIHVMKVAMCMSAATRDDLVIDDYAITSAIALVEQIKNSLDLTFRGVGDSPLAEATARIQTYIERKGMVGRNEILRDNHRHVVSEDLDRVLLVLESIQVVERFSQNGRHFWKSMSKNGTKP